MDEAAAAMPPRSRLIMRDQPSSHTCVKAYIRQWLAHLNELAMAAGAAPPAQVGRVAVRSLSSWHPRRRGPPSVGTQIGDAPTLTLSTALRLQREELCGIPAGEVARHMPVRGVEKHQMPAIKFLPACRDAHEFTLMHGRPFPVQGDT
jgi:hypothetical protein